MPAIQVLITLLLYGAFHSLTAAIGWKARMAVVIGDRAFLGLYRLAYSIVSVVTLLPILALMAAQPGRTVWSTSGLTASVLLALRVMAGIGLALALLQIDGPRFLGIKEAIAYFRGQELPLPPERLAIRGVYRLVRHPLYLFSTIALWASPVMTEALLGFALGTTIYFVVGSVLEESKMTRIFGADYGAYRKTVPWLIPFVKRGR
jgi:protein-S-isoprenylcysteine O-methyltransferase Ste14